MTQLITIVVNGEKQQLDGDSSVLDLLRALDLKPETVVVEVNREIVRRPALASTSLHEADQIELVHFVGGG